MSIPYAQLLAEAPACICLQNGAQLPLFRMLPNSQCHFRLVVRYQVLSCLPQVLAKTRLHPTMHQAKSELAALTWLAEQPLAFDLGSCILHFEYLGADGAGCPGSHLVFN